MPLEGVKALTDFMVEFERRPANAEILLNPHSQPVGFLFLCRELSSWNP